MPQKNWLPALGAGPLGLRKRSGLRLQSPDLIPRPHYRDSQLFATGTLPRNGRSLNLRPKPPLSGIPKLPTTGEFVEMGNLTAERLARLIQRVRQNPSYRDKARCFPKVIARTQGLDLAADVIVRCSASLRNSPDS